MVAAHPTKTEINKAAAKARKEQHQKERAEEEAKKRQKMEAKKQQKKVGNASKGAVKASVEKMDVKAGMGVKRITSGARPTLPSVEVVSTPPPLKSFRHKLPSVEVVSTPPPHSQAPNNLISGAWVILGLGAHRMRDQDPDHSEPAGRGVHFCFQNCMRSANATTEGLMYPDLKGQITQYGEAIYGNLLLFVLIGNMKRVPL
jgi:hypothetical protein